MGLSVAVASRGPRRSPRPSGVLVPIVAFPVLLPRSSPPALVASLVLPHPSRSPRPPSPLVICPRRLYLFFRSPHVPTHPPGSPIAVPSTLAAHVASPSPPVPFTSAQASLNPPSQYRRLPRLLTASRPPSSSSIIEEQQPRRKRLGRTTVGMFLTMPK